LNRLAVMPLVWLSAAFLAGIVASAGLPLPEGIWLMCLSLFLASLYLERRFFRARLKRIRYLSFLPLPLSILFMIFCLGGALYQFSQPVWSAGDLAWYNGRGRAEITGWVAEIPDEREKVALLAVEVETIRFNRNAPDRSVTGRLLVRSADVGIYHYGDRLFLSGSLIQPPSTEGFSYREYLAGQGIYSYLASPEIKLQDGSAGNPILRAIFSLRDQIKSNLTRMLPQSEAGLVVGVLLGDDNGLLESVQAEFRETGTAHILAVSGFNITILVALLAGLFKRFLPRLWSLVPVLTAIVLFSLMVGGQASVVRAAVMGIAAQIGLALGRRGSGENALLFTAAVMAAFNPHILWDIGFQLSFSATLGIVLWGDALSEAARKWSDRLLPAEMAGPVAGWTAEFLLITLAAQVFTLPVSAFHFGSFSWIGLLANPLVLPAQELLMILGGLAALLSLVILPYGQVLAWLAWPLCAYTLAIVRLLAGLGRGAVEIGEVSTLFVLLYYAGLFILPLYWKKLLPFLSRAVWPAALLLGSLLTLLVWRANFVAPDGRMHITRLDLSSETIYYVQTPGGYRVLIDGAGHPDQAADLVGRLTYPYPLRADALFTTLPDKAGKGLVNFLSKMPADHVFTVSNKPAPSVLQETYPALTYTELANNQVFDLGDGARLIVLGVGNDCADFEVEYDRFRMLLSGCPLEEFHNEKTETWSAVSLVMPAPGKSDIAGLSHFSSELVISRASDPGLVALPNWLRTDSEKPVTVISDGIGMQVYTSP
jgi:competence protein ComEC